MHRNASAFLISGENTGATGGDRMNTTISSQRQRVTFTSALLLAIGVLVALLLYVVLRYSASLSQGGLVSLATIVGALLAYAAAALWARGRTSDSLQGALEQGARIGPCLAPLPS
jgi:preprotein translocase subunit SecF